MYAIPLLVCAIASGASESDLAVAETLRAAVEQWQAEVAFRATYRLRAGFANSLEEALRGEIDPKLQGSPAMRFEATGVFHKQGSNLRFSVNFVGGQMILSARKGGARLKTAHMSFDEVSDGRVEVSYYPPTRLAPPEGGAFGSVAQVGKKRTKASNFAAGPNTETYIHPLKPWPNPERDPFGQFPVLAVNTVDEEHVEVISHKTYESGAERHCRVLCWTKPSPPVVEKITREFVSPDGTRDKAFALLSDFKECPGGLVARRVLFVGLHGRDRISVQEWRSEDLGDLPPSSDDFAITVAPTTMITGFKQGAPEGKVRRLEPSKIQLADLIDYEALQGASERERRAHEEPSEKPIGPGRRWMIWISGGLVVLLLSIFLFRRLRS